MADEAEDESKRWDKRQTGHRESPHLRKQSQSNVCAQGSVTRPVTVESSRSRQTGHEGSSYRFSVGTPLSNSGNCFAREAYTEGGKAGMATAFF